MSAAAAKGVGSGRSREMTRQLWAPWRLEYIRRATEREGCPFCLAVAGGDEEMLVVYRGDAAFVLLNKFPYASGHLMVAPYRHAGDFAGLTDAEALEAHRLAAHGMTALADAFAPGGSHHGCDLGRTAGAAVRRH